MTTVNSETRKKMNTITVIVRKDWKDIIKIQIVPLVQAKSTSFLYLPNMLIIRVHMDR